MNNEHKFKIGSVWRTRGGWKATVVCAARHGWCVVLHEKVSQDIPALHDKDGSTGLPAYALDTPWIDRPVIKDWPKWAKAAAMDRDGSWYWYELVPKPVCGRWGLESSEADSRRFHRLETPTWQGDWRESLVVREGGE